MRLIVASSAMRTDVSYAGILCKSSAMDRYRIFVNLFTVTKFSN